MSRIDDELDDEFFADLEHLALAVPAMDAAPALRTRLLDSIQHAHRFQDFVDSVAALCDVAKDQANQLLAAIDDAARWLMGPGDGLTVFHIDAGPRHANAIVGFTRVEPGAVFPHHTHVGAESVLVLQGGFVQPDGTTHRRGERVDMAPGTSHGFKALPGPALIYLVIIDQGIIIGDEAAGPDDPRF